MARKQLKCVFFVLHVQYMYEYEEKQEKSVRDFPHTHNTDYDDATTSHT